VSGGERQTVDHSGVASSGATLHGSDMTNPNRRLGLACAVAAYTLWGLLPLYLQVVKPVPPIELLAWRVIFTVPICVAIVAWRGQSAEVRHAFATPSLLRPLLLSSALIAGNWLIFLIAVAQDHVLATSLGYYINPLVNVLLGTVFLGERLGRLQWVAVGVATAGVLLLLGGAVGTLGISLSLALSFAFYGFVRKRTAIGSVPGLTVESLVMLPLAIGTVIWFAHGPAQSSFGHDWGLSVGLIGAGIATAIPLLLFAVAARNLDLSTLGFVQFLAPTISFVSSVTLLGESLDSLRLACFVLIWLAIGLFSADMLRRRQDS